MSGFDFATAPRIVSEDGAALRLAPLLAGLGVRRPLIVTDAGLVAAGLVAPVVEALVAGGLTAVIHDGVRADPPEADLRAAVEVARGAGADGVIGLGGGSSLDVAKLAALLLGRDQPLSAIYGVGLAQGPRVPLIQIPTTAGTGSEVTPVAILTTPDHQKAGVSSPLLLPDVAVLDATLTLGLPSAITAMTGVDAMIHAIEAFTSRRLKNPVSDSLAIAALKLLDRAIRPVIQDGRDLEARRAMLQGSMLAGMAFANAPVAAAHALAYPIGGLFHQPHGLTTSLMLTPVMGFNAPACGDQYAELSATLGGAATASAFIDRMAAIIADMPMAQRLSDVGVAGTDLDRMAADALKVQRLLINNPREVTVDDARTLYAQAL
ncbi:iron-containing alcohol dehydrogenase [Brevundimonas sp.]|uniref:iron-containing alcohol dehydrogenase n=1 Tax=Brevundimonas sp. TaxID=1871086 RepID=UPI0035B34FE5